MKASYVEFFYALSISLYIKSVASKDNYPGN